MFDFVFTSTVARIALLLGIFAIVAVVAFVAMGAALRRRDIKRGLANIAAENPAIVRRPDTGAQARGVSWAQLAAFVEEHGLDLGDTKEDRRRQKMG